MTDYDESGIFPITEQRHKRHLSNAGTQAAGARELRVRARSHIRHLVERRRHVYAVLLSFGLSRGQIVSYRTERLQELRRKAILDDDIVVHRHTRSGRRTCISSHDLLQQVVLLESLDEEIVSAREWLRHAPWP